MAFFMAFFMAFVAFFTALLMSFVAFFVAAEASGSDPLLELVDLEAELFFTWFQGGTSLRVRKRETRTAHTRNAPGLQGRGPLLAKGTRRGPAHLLCPGGAWPAGFSRGAAVAYPFGVWPPPFTGTMVGAIRSSSSSIRKRIFLQSSCFGSWRSMVGPPFGWRERGTRTANTRDAPGLQGRGPLLANPIKGC